MAGKVMISGDYAGFPQGMFKTCGKPVEAASQEMIITSFLTFCLFIVRLLREERSGNPRLQADAPACSL
jgi:hypothetical protein